MRAIDRAAVLERASQSGRREPAPVPFTKLVTFRRLEVVSFCHSTIYLALLICAFALNNPQPATDILGLSHGLLWIGMSLTCIVAARYRVVPYWLAVTVAVIGGLGPFFGSAGFVIEARREARRRQTADANLETSKLGVSTSPTERTPNGR